MSDYRDGKKHYNNVFDQLKYQNKALLNDVSDYLKQKELNRMAERQILSDIAEMVLDYQNREVPIDQLFGDNRDAFCDRLSEKALLASPAEKRLVAVRNVAAVMMLVCVITVIVSLSSRSHFALESFSWGFLFWALVFAVIFISAMFGEIYMVKKNYSVNRVSAR